MIRHTALVLAAALLLGTATVWAEEEASIHLTGQKDINWNWSINDSAGTNWSFNSNGSCSGGYNNIFGSLMQLTVNNSGFSYGEQGIGGSEGREAEIGPWSAGAVKVSRRMYLDPKLPYARWIDIFENTASSEQSVSVRYSSNLNCSIKQVNTVSGKAEPNAKDYGVITSDPANNSYPAAIHIYGSKNAKIKPKFQYSKNSSTFTYSITLKVPAGKTAALCFFESYSKQTGDAEKFLKTFNFNQEMNKIPKSLRKIIVNMGMQAQALGDLELPRNENGDLVITSSDEELTGTIANEKYLIKTFYGDVEVKAAQVLGLASMSGEEVVQVALLDGQVVSGKLASGPIQFRLPDGSDMTFPLNRIKTAAYKVSEARPDELIVKCPLLVLRAGQQLALADPNQLDLSYETQQGQVKLNPADVKAIQLDTPEGGLHRAMLTNGTVMSGLLVTEKIKATLTLGPTLEIRRHMAKAILLPTPAVDATYLVHLSLRNEDELCGKLTDKTIALDSKGNKMNVNVEDIAQIDFIPNAFAQVAIKLHSGTTMNGKLLSNTIGFAVEPGPQMTVFVGQINQINCPKPPPPPSTQPASGPSSQPTSGPATRPTSGPSGKPREATPEQLEKLKKLEDQLASLKAMHDKLAASSSSSSKTRLSSLEKLIVKKEQEITTVQEEIANPKESADKGEKADKEAKPETPAPEAPKTEAPQRETPATPAPTVTPVQLNLKSIQIDVDGLDR